MQVAMTCVAQQKQMNKYIVCLVKDKPKICQLTADVHKTLPSMPTIKAIS